MAESKKVVIKINIDKHTSDLSIKPPIQVTVWHKQRIGVALLLLAVLLGGCYYGLRSYFAPVQNMSENTSALLMSSAAEGRGDGSTSGGQLSAPPQIIEHAVAAASVEHDKTESASSEAKRKFAIIFDKNVLRASLNSALKDNEPYQLVTSPIKLAENQRIELFYFTELRGIKHKVFYHNWSKDEKLVYKKQLAVHRKQLKVNSAKILSYNDKGNWQIQLVDKTGKVFSEVNFVVD